MTLRARSILLVTALAALAPRAAAAQPKAAPAAAPKLTRAPKLVTFVEAPYPPAERASGKTATVVLQIAISATGTVDRAGISESGGPAFDAAAVAAAQQFVFEPAEIDGNPAPVKILYRYEFTLKPEVPTTGVFDGVVRSRKKKTPLVGVSVALDSGQHVTTDAAGHFHVDAVAPGKHALTLEGAKLTAQRTEETFEAGKRLDVTYDVEEREEAAKEGDGDDLEIVITAPPIRKQVVSTEVSAEQGRRVPGAQGDVLRVVENLPGVARSTVGSGALVVWGASPEDTRVYVDGVRVPRLYHDGGLRSVVHSDLVKSVELAPGGYGASYGRGLGGLVTVALDPLEDRGFHGSIAADVLDAAGSVRASLGEKIHVEIAARKSYLDALLPVFTSRDVSSLFPVPRYADGQARVVYRPDAHTTFEVGGLASSDATDRSTPSADPAQRKTESTTLRWGRVYARVRRENQDGSVVTVTPWVGADASTLVSRFGGTPASLTNDSTLFGLRASWRGKPIAGVVVTAGVDAEAVSASIHRAGSVTSPPREGDARVFGQAPSDRVNADTWSAVVAGVAPFAEADVSLVNDRLHLLPGLRFDPYVISGSRRTPVEGATPSVGYFTSEALFEPRLAVTADLSPRVKVKAAYGRYHQTPQVEDLSAVFGNPTLTAARADHFLAGALFRLSETTGVETTVFYTSSTDLAARSASPAPLLAEALEQTGSGRSFGAQILVRKEIGAGLFGWVSYSLLRSERRDRDGAAWRLFDFDQTHVLTALASYRIGAGFEIGARARVATGFPRTPVRGAYYDARTDTFEPVLGPQSSIRIPAFFALDVRVSRRFAIGASELEIYLDVQNATNRQNPEELVYTRDYTQQSAITGLPILPSLGARFAW
jgi:TonB family protein